MREVKLYQELAGMPDVVEYPDLSGLAPNDQWFGLQEAFYYLACAQWEDGSAPRRSARCATGSWRSASTLGCHQCPVSSWSADMNSSRWLWSWQTMTREASGDKDVLVQGAGTARLALAGGVLDEIELHVIPVLRQGRLRFEGLAPEQIELKRTRILEGEGGVTHMHYRVQR
jgi:hypothetical protein